jgi:hypothetical protein
MGRRKDGRSRSMRHFSSTSNFSCTLVCFVFQFVGKDIFCVSRATFSSLLLLLFAILEHLHITGVKWSLHYTWREREREREREVCSLAQSEREEETGTLTG